MPSVRIETWARGQKMAAPVGFYLDVPDGVVVERPVAGESRVRLVERRADGRIVGDLDLALFWPALIMDREGTLRDEVTRAADALLVGRKGDSGLPLEIELGCGPAWLMEVCLRRDEHGGKPAMPYQNVMAIGHPDLRLSAALFVISRSADDSWPAGRALLDSLRWAGRLPSALPRVEGLVMTS